MVGVKGSNMDMDNQELFEREVIRWRFNGGSEYSLVSINHDSTILDIGCYCGKWSAEISKRFDKPRIKAFEPIKEFYINAVQNLAEFDNVEVFNCGVWVCDGVMNFHKSDDATGFYVRNNLVDRVSVISIEDAMNFFGGSVDAMEINIEGGEYNLLSYMISKGLIKSIGQLMIQFHTFGPDGDLLGRMNYIRNRLSKTHEPLFTYDFVWDHWVRKD